MPARIQQHPVAEHIDHASGKDRIEVIPLHIQTQMNESQSGQIHLQKDDEIIVGIDVLFRNENHRECEWIIDRIIMQRSQDIRTFPDREIPLGNDQLVLMDEIAEDVFQIPRKIQEDFIVLAYPISMRDESLAIKIEITENSQARYHKKQAVVHIIFKIFMFPDHISRLPSSILFVKSIV